MKRFRFLFYLLWLTCGISASGTDILFRLFDVENGLPESQVRSLTRLPDGRVFVLTEGMVNIYDGSEFKTLHYKPAEYGMIDYTNQWENYVDEAGLVWIKRLNVFLILDLKRERFIENPDQYIAKTFGIREKIRNFTVDQSGDFWFFTRRNQLYRYDKKQQKSVLVPYAFSSKSRVYEVVKLQNRIYVFTTSGEILTLEPSTLQVLNKDEYLSSYFKTRDPFSQVCVVGDDLYLFTSDEQGESHFFRWKSKGKNWKKLYTDTRIFTSISSLQDGRILLSGEGGLYYFDPSGRLLDKQSVFYTEEGRTVSGKIVDLLSDQQGGLWIAFNNYGLLYYNPYRIRFNHMPNTLDLGSGKKIDNVCALLMLNEKEMLAGTMHGLYVYNRVERTLRLFAPELSGIFVLSLSRDLDGDIWVSTIDSGCYRISKGKIRHYEIRPEGIGEIEKNIRGIYRFPGMGYWLICRSLGAGRFDPSTGRYTPLIEKHPELKRVGMTTHVIPWDGHSLLFASQNGLFLYDVSKDKVSFPDRGKDSHFFNHSSRKYNCVMRDSRGWIWFGTQDGLNLYIPQAKKSFSYYMEDGLVNNSIRSIVEDKEGRMWIATSNGLSHFILSEDVNKPVHYIQNFDSRSGLLRGEYLERAAYLFPDGALYLGGLNGISELLPNQMKVRHEELTSLFSSLKVMGREVAVGELEKDILTQSIFVTQKIELPYTQNTLSIDFSTLNFANPEQTHYRYRLEGSGNPEWTEVKSVNGKGTVSFTSLSPGKYRLVVYAAGGDYQWGETPAVLDIVIRPPFYFNTFSITVYILLFMALIAYLWISMMRKKERQLREKQEKEQLHQEEKLNQLKYRFITNVSHELRTPLTLIVTPLEHLLRTLTDESVKKQLKVVVQGAFELRGMINQLLDFRRMEMKGEKLNPTYNDISAYLQSVHSGFMQLAEERGIVFNLNRQQLMLNMWYDKEKMQKILNNLLSNAFKFTPEGGVIDLRQSVGFMPGEEQMKALCVEVVDSGCGIPYGDQPHIFERFYQGDNQGNTTGSGVGLHLTMEYVKMHGGIVRVESEPGKGSHFTVWIPLREYGEEAVETEKRSGLDIQREKEHSAMPVPEVSSLEGEENQVQDGKLKILIADDNDSLLKFMADLLIREYDVLIATDGLKAYELAKQSLPDLIISDVMMPGMDGFELCNRLKNDIQTSHIPVILLTAKNSDEDQISGYQAGADAYIAKPFNYEILRLRIRRIFELLDKRKKAFRQSVEVEPKKITISKLDEELIGRAMDLVMKNLDNSEYTVEQFSRDMNMDRTGLYRKLLSLVGLTPVAFIRSIRMKEAAKLLKEKYVSISDVAYRVGYSTPRYFSKHFMQEFGVHPSDFAQTEE